MERKNSGYKINLEKPMDKQKKNKIKSNKLNINNAKNTRLYTNKTQSDAEILGKNTTKLNLSFDEKINYVIRNSKDERDIADALKIVIREEIKQDKRISMSALDNYFIAFNNNNQRIIELNELSHYGYKYKELINLKLAEVEIECLKDKSKSNTNEFIRNKINYIHTLIDEGIRLSKQNNTEPYLLELYETKKELYILENEEQNKRKIEKVNIEINNIILRLNNTNKGINNNTTKSIFNSLKSNNKQLNTVNQKSINNVNVQNTTSNTVNKKKTNKIMVASILLIGLLIVANLMFSSKNNTLANTTDDNINKSSEVVANSEQENYNDENYYEESETEPKVEEKKVDRAMEGAMSSAPTVKKSLPTRYSEYGDYSSTKQSYFMEQEDLLTEYYTDYEKAVSNADYSYVRGDLVDDGQLSKELKISIPQYKHKSVYVKHFSIYNLEMYGEDKATFSLDTVFVVDNERIQIETQKMTTYYDYYNQRWLIDNYTDWDIIYKQEYDPNVDYFDFTNYREYF